MQLHANAVPLFLADCRWFSGKGREESGWRGCGLRRHQRALGLPLDPSRSEEGLVGRQDRALWPTGARGRRRGGGRVNPALASLRQGGLGDRGASERCPVRRCLGSCARAWVA